MSDSDAVDDRQLGLIVLKSLARRELESLQRQLEDMSGEQVEVPKEVVDGRLAQLRMALRVAEELLAVPEKPVRRSRGRERNVR